ncbi:ABC transporter permease subunit [Halopiger goleimassiliensis]|uniref:ABC transporter permease subunit n=1 Tax=Halopiger goleimassiliensis TaxID=1293048 RepID=UPI0006781E4E|nr:ABC transporter permease subunit [Halopiger goleimassiliensis]
MRTPTVRREIHRFSRSRWAWTCWLVVTALLVVAVVRASPPQSVGSVDVHPILFVLFAPAGATFEAVVRTFVSALVLVPLVAFVHSHSAIAEERETGRLRVLLTMPCSRRELYEAKLLGRSVTFLGPLVGTLGAVGLALVATTGTVAGGYGYVVAAACLLGLACVSIGVAISAAASTTNRAVAAFFAVYAGMLVAYPITVLRSALPYGLVVLDPLFAAAALLTNSSPHVGMPGAVEGGATDFVTAAPVPVYLTDWFLVAVLLGWTVVPAVIGRWWLTRPDLS